MTKEKRTEYLSGVPYKMRLEDLQRRYKNLSRRRKAPRYEPGSEAERVYLSGRY